MRIFSVLVVWLLLASSAFSQDDALPQSVATPYLAYEAAVEAGDAQAAAEAAEQARRAALAAGIDPSIVSVLAENAGLAAYGIGQFETAENAFLSAVEMNEQSAGDPFLRARALRYVSNIQLREGENRRSFSTAEDALDILEELPSAPHVDMEIALANVFMTSSHWVRGNYRSAGRYGERAVQAARRAGVVQAPVFGIAAFQTGAYYSIEDQPLEAAYWFAVANAVFSQTESDSDVRAAARAWGGMEREELDSDERAALLDRLRADAVYQAEYEESLLEAASGRDEGWVDAFAVNRRSPRYPEGAQWAGAEGYALMRFDVNAEGRTENVEIVYSIPYREFGEEGERAVRQWRYQPATQNGVPVVQTDIVTLLEFVMAN